MLTKEQLKHLRKATAVRFLHWEGASYILTSVERRGQETTTDTLPTLSKVERYTYRRAPISAYYRLPFANVSRIWQTIAGHLRPGDVLELHWGLDAQTNENLREANFHGDRLDLNVIRRNKAFTYHIAMWALDHEYPARMVRYFRGIEVQIQ